MRLSPHVCLDATVLFARFVRPGEKTTAETAVVFIIFFFVSCEGSFLPVPYLLLPSLVAAVV